MSNSSSAVATPPVLVPIVEQHAEETLHLMVQRDHLLGAPGAPWLAFERIDERLAAHVDGLRVAGDTGRAVSEALAAADEVPAVCRFAATVLALEAGDTAGVERLLARPGADGGADAGALAALGWVSPTFLRGIVAGWLGSNVPVRQRAALAALSAHGADAGAALAGLIGAGPDDIAIAAMHSAVAAGRTDVQVAFHARSRGASGRVLFEAARAAVLLGDRSWSLEALEHLAAETGTLAPLRLHLMALDVPHGMSRLKRLTGPRRDRLLVQGSGIVGDPALAPWLLQKTSVPATARIAGEALALIAGIDLSEAGLDQPRPRQSLVGPTDDPADDDVDVDPDETLPWPEPERLAAWWSQHGQRLPSGARSFMGAPVSAAHALAVLRTARQGARLAAAEHLCLQNAGTPLFNTAAPAWRQRRRLAQAPAG